ncbi:MAG: L-lysine 6-transaminase [Bacteroidota bacterium]|nr:L-lysine 6-transaminase [Bacteroidota bacterium]MDP4231405.1 L-lysine 6-transaminase [Bacteroidota bacterium]MDP4236805.1 L-lysine 6-transaminase [Bacteroidota bacterium]
MADKNILVVERSAEIGASISTAPFTADHSLPVHIEAGRVHETLAKHMLVDGFDLVVDLERSQGSWIFDARTGKRFLDFFTFFASGPVGLNHPKMLEGGFKERLLHAAINKPSSSDAYTVEMAEFVETFSRVAIPEYLPHLFLIEGGSAAVENALKVAFDWKIRKNFVKGYTQERGHLVMHFRYSFHGRNGYGLSLTNTDPNKTMYFPKFKEWPRIDSPFLHYPLNEANMAQALIDEDNAIKQMKEAFTNYPDQIAAIIIEPIQGEGGDNHFSKRFLMTLRRLADENDAILIFDEVQTGVAITGKMWAHQYFVQPDIMAFGKKMQVCGLLASKRIDEVHDNVFMKSSRINSTWGGNLVDMLRSQKYLEIIAEENLVENARIQGDYLLSELRKIEAEFPNLVSNTRGLGLFCAFTVSEAQLRDVLKQKCYDEGVIIIGCGDRSIRFRPPLNISKDEIDLGIKVIREQLKELSVRDY